METFTTAREFVTNSKYFRDRDKNLNKLNLDIIDLPIREVVKCINDMPHCFTLQSCYGHFLYASGQDPHNLDRLPHKYDGQVTYRIAYIALCIENSQEGHKLLDSLAQIPLLDPEYIQFGSADWFWKQYRNSYVLQVEPDRFKLQDQCIMGHTEALYIENVRDMFFEKLRDVFRTGKD